MEDNENKNKTPWWAWLVLLALPVAAWGAWRIIRNPAKAINKATEDLADYENSQAILLKNLMGVTKTAGIWHTVSEIGIYPSKTHVKILNVMLSVVDWPKLQKKFLALCDNQYTLIDALTAALTDADFQKAIEFAGARKVVTIAAIQRGAVTYQPNTVLGVLYSEGVNFIGNKTYNVINEITTNWNRSEDEEIIIDVPQDMCKLM